MSTLALQFHSELSAQKTKQQEELDKQFEPEPIPITNPLAYGEFDKIEIDENGRQLKNKPNKGFKLGSYKFKSGKKK